jgi:hypothetical protein
VLSSLDTFLDEPMGHLLRAGAELKHRKNLGEGIDRQPEHLCSAAQPRAEFVQLQVGNLQISEAALMEDLSVQACTREKGS